MSVSLVFVPVALAMRVIMGRENFENWTNSMQVKVPTNFKNELELVRTIKKAGFDAVKWGGSIKTHINGEKEFFFWDKVDGEWRAVFSKYDSQQTIDNFMKQVETSAGRIIFPSREEHHWLPPDKITASYPTNFKEPEILMQILNDYEANPIRQSSGDIICKLDSIDLRFKPAIDGPFSVEVTTNKDINRAYGHLSALDEDYKRNVQAITYTKLKQRINEHNLAIEDEEVMEDNSIVLTINIMR